MFRFLVPVLFVTWFTVTGAAQTFRGAINGEVTDASGAVLPGVSVVATAIATHVDYATVTSGAGEFLFRDLPLGTYTK
jgi:hypothetical protein